MTLGRAAFVLVLVVLVYWTPQWMPRGGGEAEPREDPVLDSLRDLQARSRASEERRQEALQRVLREAETHRGALSEQQLAMIEELKSARAESRRQRVVINLMQTLEASSPRTLSFGEWLAQTGAWIEETYALIQPRARHSLWAIALGLVLVGFFGAILSFTHLARRAAALGFRLSRGWLVVLSFVAIVLVIVTRTNPWAAFPSEVLMAPLLALIGCALALRFVDFNYPVWNSLVRGCGAPLISMAFTIAYLSLLTAT